MNRDDEIHEFSKELFSNKIHELFEIFKNDSQQNLESETHPSLGNNENNFASENNNMSNTNQDSLFVNNQNDTMKLIDSHINDVEKKYNSKINICHKKNYSVNMKIVERNINAEKILLYI